MKELELTMPDVCPVPSIGEAIHQRKLHAKSKLSSNQFCSPLRPTPHQWNEVVLKKANRSVTPIKRGEQICPELAVEVHRLRQLAN